MHAQSKQVICLTMSKINGTHLKTPLVLNMHVIINMTNVICLQIIMHLILIINLLTITDVIDRTRDIKTIITTKIVDKVFTFRCKTTSVMITIMIGEIISISEMYTAVIAIIIIMQLSIYRVALQITVFLRLTIMIHDNQMRIIETHFILQIESKNDNIMITDKTNNVTISKYLTVVINLM